MKNNTLIIDEYGFIVNFVEDEDKEVAMVAAAETNK